MIRPASEILKENMPHGKLFESVAIQAIKVAQRETIEECAKKGKIIQTGNKRTSVPTGSNFNSVMAHIPVYEFDKQSILNLLNEVK